MAEKKMRKKKTLGDVDVDVEVLWVRTMESIYVSAVDSGGGVG